MNFNSYWTVHSVESSVLGTTRENYSGVHIFTLGTTREKLLWSAHFYSVAIKGFSIATRWRL